MGENTDFESQRQFERIPFAQTPWLFTIEAPEPSFLQNPAQLEAQNISLGGLKFNSNHKIAVFREVKIRLLDRRGLIEPIQVKARVIRVEETDLGLDEKTFGMAVSFDTLSESIRALLHQVLQPLSGRNSPSEEP